MRTRMNRLNEVRQNLNALVKGPAVSLLVSPYGGLRQKSWIALVLALTLFKYDA